MSGKKCGAERATVADILALVVNNYMAQDKRTTTQIESQIINNLVPELGSIRVADLATKDIERYKKVRRSQNGHSGSKTKNATIDRELSLVRRALTLGRRESPPMVIRDFYVEMLPDKNIRQGFMTDDQYPLLLAALPGYLRPIFVVAYKTGIRKSQLRSLNWSQVDFVRRVIVWRPNQTKGRCSARYPFYG